MKTKISTVLFCLLSLNIFSQALPSDNVLAKIKNTGFQHSQAMNLLHELTDVYGQRLAGSREYLSAAKWALHKMKDIGLENVHFENYCEDCRGWSVNSFNVEMVAPNYMHIVAYPLAMTKSTKGIVEGEVLHIVDFKNMDSLKLKFTGKLKGKIILLGEDPQPKSLTDTILRRLSADALKTSEQKLAPIRKQTPMSEQLAKWKADEVPENTFLQFVENEGALAVLKTRSMLTGIIDPQGTYNYKENDLKPLPFFTIMPEHFGRLSRLLKQNLVPRIKLNLETNFYLEPENNVNIIGEITGSDPKLKSEVILIGGHFDSWHSASGATDNGVSCITLIEALRILKQNDMIPKRTIKIGLWGGEEQAFIGSLAFARQHYGELGKQPNIESQNVAAYLNLDNGAGAIRGIYLQGNEFARPVFEQVFAPLSSLNVTTITIENTLSTDHETFDNYNIPSFQFIQDPLSYNTVTHHTHLDFPEYVPEQDLIKNAVILSWTIYSISGMSSKIPRKIKD